MGGAVHDRTVVERDRQHRLVTLHSSGVVHLHRVHVAIGLQCIGGAVDTVLQLLHDVGDGAVVPVHQRDTGVAGDESSRDPVGRGVHAKGHRRTVAQLHSDLGAAIGPRW